MKQIVRFLIALFFFQLQFHFSFSQAPGVGKKIMLSSLEDAALGSCLLPNKTVAVIGVDSVLSPYSYNLKENIVFGRPFITLHDTTGAVVWRRNYAGQIGALNSVIVGTDGNLVAAGVQYRHIFDDDTSRIILTKFGASGEILFDKRFELHHFRTGKLIQSKNGDFLLVGSAKWHQYAPKGQSDVLLIRFNSNGNVLWVKSYGGSGVEHGTSLLEMENGDLLIGANSTSVDNQVSGNLGGEDAWIILTNSQGEIVWKKNYGGSGTDRIHDIVATGDGSYIGVGGTSSADGHLQSNQGVLDAWIMKFDEAGNLLWSRNYGGSAEEELTGARRVLGKGLLLSGFTASSDGDVSEHFGGFDSWIMQISFDGHLVWQKNIGNSFNDYVKGSEVLDEFSFIHAFSEEVVVGRYFDVDASLIMSGNSNRIRGFVFHDSNKNGNYDAGEKPFDLATIHIANYNQDTITTAPRNGKFVIYTGIGDFVTSVQFPDDRFTVPGSYSSSFPSYFNTDSFNIPVQVNAVLSDLSVAVTPLTPARPGFQSKYRISVTNNGSANVLNVRLFFKPDAHMKEFEFFSTPDEVRPDTSFWNLTNIAIGELRSIDISTHLDIPPQLNFGDTLVLSAGITGDLYDIVPSDNKTMLNQIVVGSFDPNDKSENHGGQITPAEIADGQFLTYTIRFQNTGTDTAFNVRIVDSISSDHILSSMQMIASSHDYQLTRDGNQLEWRFDNIHLVDSNRNEPASHGFVSFRIRPATNLQEGDILSNHASIYFDYNLPVITNNVETIVMAEHILPVTLRFFDASKTGAHIDLVWQTSYEQNVMKFVVEKSPDGRTFTALQEVAATGVITGSRYKVIDNKPLPGKNYYRIKSIDVDGRIAYSNIEVVELKLASAGIMISPNPVIADLSVKNAQRSLQGVSYSVFTMSGTRVAGGLLNLPIGTTKIPINLAKLPKGIYVLSLNNSDISWSQRFVLE